MSLAPGARLGGYEITGALGAGGMGEVYRARDSKLGRSVALKLLLDAVAGDPDRIARFEREAKSLAALNHPHIAALFGLEQSNGRHFLVMELVEGETLAERIARGPLPLEQALSVAVQIADALEAAHEKGIVHRDLKPANVKITPDELVKVLDFGLAKAMETESAVSNLAHSPTLSMMATQAGMILGTAAYMSPEQAKGKPADQRSDVFSFGVVLYEMLTGRQPFQGETAPEILASVLIREPELSGLPPNLNPRLPDLLKRCLDKNPKRRWQAIGDVRAELETIAANPRAVPATALAGAPQPMWKRVVPILATAFVVAGATAAAMWSLRPSQPAPVTRFLFTFLPTQQLTNANRPSLTLSPDGTQVVYIASNRLFVRSMAELEPRAIPGTESAAGLSNPVFSPDGRTVAFYTGTDCTLKKVAVSGGAAVTIYPVDTPPQGVTWSENDILFAQPEKGILRVSANGGAPQLLVAMKAGEALYRPEMLPGGEFILFTLAGTGGGLDWDKAQIVIQSVKTSARRVLVSGGSDGRYVPTGHIVYALGGVLFVVPFDLRHLTVSGGPVPIVEGVRRGAGGGGAAAQFAFSSTGSLVYSPGPATTSGAQRDLVLVDRTGAVERVNVPAGPYDHPRFSPDGKRVAFGIDDRKDVSVWIYDLSGTTAMRRLAFGGKDRFPAWSANSERVAFQSDREGDAGIFWQRADGNGPVERLTKADAGAAHIAESWSPAGDRLLFSVTKGAVVSLSVLTLPDKTVAPFDAVQSERPTSAVFSPDGRWVAYATSDATGGRDTVYVQPFPPTGTKYQISKDEGGHHPLWSPDGKELTFIPDAGRLVGVSITTKPSFSFGNPVSIPRAFSGSNGSAEVRSHDISADGKRFIGLVNGSSVGPAGTLSAPQLQVVLNWFEDLKTRVPVK